MKINIIKNKISKVIFFLLLFQIISGIIYADNLEDFKQVAENEYLALFINQESTVIAVQDKNSNNIWYSNPPDSDEMDNIARGNARDELNSQILLSFYLPGNRRRQMNNYTDSILY